MATKPSKSKTVPEVQSDESLLIGIVVSDWNHDITDNLLLGCRATLIKNGVKEENIKVQHVPGSFELPMGVRLLVAGEKFDAIVCLGCVIKGETDHDKYIAQAVSNGIMQLSLALNIPVIFGVLTPNSQEQAEERAGGTLGNKGDEAAITALKMGNLRKKMTTQAQKIGFS